MRISLGLSLWLVISSWLPGRTVAPHPPILKRTLRIKASDADHVRFEGRHALSAVAPTNQPASMSQDDVLFDWPCTSFSVSVAAGVAVVVEMDGGGNRFVLRSSLEPNSTTTLATSHGLRNYSCFPQTKAPAVLTVRKITEAGPMWGPPMRIAMRQGVARLRAIYASSAGSGKVDLVRTFETVDAPEGVGGRRILVIGDSDSAGFGVLGPDRVLGSRALAAAECAAKAVSYESCDDDYSAFVARRLNSGLTVIAWSGRGLVQNAEEELSRSPTMPFYWNKSLGTDPSRLWNMSSWIPQLVLIYLGSNDYTWNRKHPPTNATFHRGYHDLLGTIFNTFPHAIAVSLCGGGARGNQIPCPHVASAVHTAPGIVPGSTNINTRYLEVPEKLVGDGDWGCWNHRSVVAQKKISDFVSPRLADMLGWDEP